MEKFFKTYYEDTERLLGVISAGVLWLFIVAIWLGIMWCGLCIGLYMVVDWVVYYCLDYGKEKKTVDFLFSNHELAERLKV